MLSLKYGGNKVPSVVGRRSLWTVRTVNLIVSWVVSGLRGLPVSLALWALVLIGAPATIGGPIETNVFAVQGVSVDVTSTDAASAKNQALMEVQVKAFFELVGRLGSPDLATDLQKKMTPEEIAPFLRSLSIEQESASPGRYMGTFTVRFLPQKMQPFLAGYGFRVPVEQADPILVVPVFRAPDGLKLWEDNPWRQAWIDLKGEQGIVPIIIPLGDLEDTETLTAEDAVNADALKLEALRRRYGAPSLLVVQAQLAEQGGVHVFVEGDTRLGRVTINKVYAAEPGSSVTAEDTAVRAFQTVVMKAYQEAARIAEATRGANTRQSIAVTVPFGSPREWNAIRSRILTTPNVSAVDLATLSADGAVIKLVYTHTLEELRDHLQRTGLGLFQTGTGYLIQPL